MAEEKVSQYKVYLFMGLMLITGSINTIANKMQQSQIVLGKEYSRHQKFITFCMFHGELVCLIIYLIGEKRKKMKEKEEAKDSSLLKYAENEEKENSKNEEIKSSELIKSADTEEDNPQPKFWYFLFPALFDLVGSTLSSISLTFLASSVYQMFRGAIIIFTLLASITFLKTKYYRHHFLGITVVVIGLIVVGLSAIRSKATKSENPKLGILLIITSQLFSAGMFITEEKLLKRFKGVSPLRTVGSEGLWGVLCYYLLMIIFYNVRCESWSDTLKNGICFQDDKGTYRLENALFALRQIAKGTGLKCFLILYICSIALFNYAGLTVTKLVTATARTIVDTLRTIIVWLFFLTIPGLPKKCKESFEFLQLIGFFILILGSAIYNEILVLPFLGFNLYTKKALKERDSTINNLLPSEQPNEEKETESK